MKTVTITPPNNCGLSVTNSKVLFYNGINVPFYIDDDAVFTEYLTYDDAAAAALSVDPSFNTTKIYGPISYKANEINQGEYFYGESAVLKFEVNPFISNEYTISYQWTDEGGVDLPGKTSSTLNLGGASSIINGVYFCKSTISSSDGRVEEVKSNPFNVHTYPVSGKFTITRNTTDIIDGPFTFYHGFVDTDVTISIPRLGLIIPFGSDTGFQTTNAPLESVEYTAELCIKGEFVKSFRIPAESGTFTYTFSK